jgi:hypothetical protein
VTEYCLRKHVRLGDVVKVPKRALRIETPDHERGIPGRTRPEKKARCRRVGERVWLRSSIAL